MSEPLKHIIQQGTILLLSEGEYDDYRVTRVVTVCKAIPQDIETRFVAQQGTRTDVTTQFAQWLIDAGYVQPLLCHELYLGGYGDLDLRLERLV